MLSIVHVSYTIRVGGYIVEFKIKKKRIYAQNMGT
jgi:hypothetical protein